MRKRLRVHVCVCEESKRDTHRLTAVARCEGTLVPAVKVWGGAFMTPGIVCERSGSSFALNKLWHWLALCLNLVFSYHLLLLVSWGGIC